MVQPSLNGNFRIIRRVYKLCCALPVPVAPLRDPRRLACHGRRFVDINTRPTLHPISLIKWFSIPLRFPCLRPLRFACLRPLRFASLLPALADMPASFTWPSPPSSLESGDDATSLPTFYRGIYGGIPSSDDDAFDPYGYSSDEIPSEEKDDREHGEDDNEDDQEEGDEGGGDEEEEEGENDGGDEDDKAKHGGQEVEAEEGDVNVPLIPPPDVADGDVAVEDEVAAVEEQVVAVEEEVAAVDDHGGEPPLKRQKTASLGGNGITGTSSLAKDVVNLDSDEDDE